MQVSDALKALDARIKLQDSSFEVQMKAFTYLSILQLLMVQNVYAANTDLNDTSMGPAIDQLTTGLPPLPLQGNEQNYIDSTHPEFHNTVEHIIADCYEQAQLRGEEDIIPAIFVVQMDLHKSVMPQNTVQNNNNQPSQPTTSPSLNQYQKIDKSDDLRKYAILNSMYKKDNGGNNTPS